MLYPINESAKTTYKWRVSLLSKGLYQVEKQSGQKEGNRLSSSQSDKNNDFYLHKKTLENEIKYDTVVKSSTTFLQLFLQLFVQQFCNGSCPCNY